MTLLFFTAVWIFVSYLTVAIVCNRGVPKSISDTFYVFGGENEHGYLFTFAMWCTAIPLLISWLSVTADNLMFLPFLSCSAMCFVGAACAFKQKLTKTVHYTSAFVWAGSAIVWNCFYGNQGIIIVSLLFALVCLGIDKLRHMTFWFELACVASMVIGIGKQFFV